MFGGGGGSSQKWGSIGADTMMGCDRTDKTQSFADKVTAVERLLAEDEKGDGDADGDGAGKGKVT